MLKNWWNQDRLTMLSILRKNWKRCGPVTGPVANPSPQYDHQSRMHMRNSLTMDRQETEKLLSAQTPHVIRIKMPENEIVHLNDMIRGSC